MEDATTDYSATKNVYSSLQVIEMIYCSNLICSKSVVSLELVYMYKI